MQQITRTFASQGISEVEDGTLVIRAKFKAKAGKQILSRPRPREFPQLP